MTCVSQPWSLSFSLLLVSAMSSPVKISDFIVKSTVLFLQTHTHTHRKKWHQRHQQFSTFSFIWALGGFSAASRTVISTSEHERKLSAGTAHGGYYDQQRNGEGLKLFMLVQNLMNLILLDITVILLGLEQATNSSTN